MTLSLLAVEKAFYAKLPDLWCCFRCC